jgi:hypothetical protein
LVVAGDYRFVFILLPTFKASLTSSSRSFSFSFVIPSSTAVSNRSSYGDVKHSGAFSSFFSSDLILFLTADLSHTSVTAFLELEGGLLSNTISSKPMPIWIVGNPSPAGELLHSMDLNFQHETAELGVRHRRFNLACPSCSTSSSRRSLPLASPPPTSPSPLSSTSGSPSLVLLALSPSSPSPLSSLSASNCGLRTVPLSKRHLETSPSSKSTQQRFLLPPRSSTRPPPPSLLAQISSHLLHQTQNLPATSPSPRAPSSPTPDFAVSPPTSSSDPQHFPVPRRL